MSYFSISCNVCTRNIKHPVCVQQELQEAIKIRFLCPFSEVTQKATKLKLTDDSHEFSFLGVYKYLRYFCFGLCLTFTQSCAEGVYLREVALKCLFETFGRVLSRLCTA